MKNSFEKEIAYRKKIMNDRRVFCNDCHCVTIHRLNKDDSLTCQLCLNTKI